LIVAHGRGGRRIDKEQLLVGIMVQKGCVQRTPSATAGANGDIRLTSQELGFGIRILTYVDDAVDLYRELLSAIGADKGGGLSGDLSHAEYKSFL
jgi:hypothetical protein